MEGWAGGWVGQWASWLAYGQASRRPAAWGVAGKAHACDILGQEDKQAQPAVVCQPLPALLPNLPLLTTLHCPIISICRLSANAPLHAFCLALRSACSVFVDMAHAGSVTEVR